MTVRTPILEQLVIKPSLACTANCPTCAGRRDLHREVRAEPRLSVDDWERVLGEARTLGTWELVISGGEPTLYPGLSDLIAIGRSFGWKVRLNSNGSLLNASMAARLVRAGLDVVDVSLYSSDAGVHDGMRRSNGLWTRATSAIELLAALRGSHPGFTVISQTVLCRENLSGFARLLDLHRRLGSGGLVVSYLEGDFARQHLADADDIRRFRETVVPAAAEVCDALDPAIREVARRRVTGLFAAPGLRIEDWAAGIYQPGTARCRIPRRFAMILANGDVHPCDVVEYTHEPVIGNVRNQSLAVLWQSAAWQRYRRHLNAECRHCPMNLHTYIPLRPGGARADLARTWLSRLHLDQLEQTTYSRIMRVQVRRHQKSGREATST